MKSDSIDHDSALDVVDVLFAFVVEPERLAVVFFVVDSPQRKKSAAMLNKVVSGPIWVRMKSKRMCRQGIYLDRSPKLINLNLSDGFSNPFPIEIQIATLDAEVCRTI